MGYTIRAFIGHQPHLQTMTENFLAARIVSLRDDLAIVPLTDELYDEINKLVASPGVGSFTLLTANVEQQVLEIIQEKKQVISKLNISAGMDRNQPYCGKTGSGPGCLATSRRQSIRY